MLSVILSLLSTAQYYKNDTKSRPQPQFGLNTSAVVLEVSGKEERAIESFLIIILKLMLYIHIYSFVYQSQ